MVEKKIRTDLMLPSTLARHARIETLDRLIDWLWHDAPTTADTPDFSPLRTYLSLMTDSIMPASVAREALRMLWHYDPDDLGRVCLPAQRGERSARKIFLLLAPKTRLSIHCSMVLKPARSAKRSENTARIPTDSELAAKLKRQLALTIKHAGKNWALSMADVSELAPYIAMRAGAEPYHCAVLKNVVRPVSQHESDPYQLNGVSMEASSHFLHKAHGSELRLRDARRPIEEIDSGPTDLTEEWIGESKKILRWLCETLQDHISGHCDTARKKERARQTFAEARDRIPEFFPKSCATRIAIDFAESKFVGGGSITVSTLRTYLSRCVVRGLLDCDAALSLADWDPDDFLENVEGRLNARRLNTRTKEFVIHAYDQLLKFACPKLGIPRVSLSSLSRGFIGGAGQWRLVSPHAIDRLLRLLTDSGDTISRQIAVTVALAFYGGMRATEIRKLTLNDVVAGGRLGTFEIEIVRGKTPNARRRVPLHALSGRSVQKLMQTEWKRRCSQFSSATLLSTIAFLGPPGNPAGYSYGSLSSACRAALKDAFGKPIDIHSLRHSFCSILFVRWYALRHPDILFDLRDRSHEIYQPACQGKLQEFFGGLHSQEGDIRPYDLIQVIKVTGHASPATFFVYYVHSYSLVHAHTVMRIADESLDESFSDREIEALVPGMQSSTSRAKLKDKTIRGICRKKNLM